MTTHTPTNYPTSQPASQPAIQPTSQPTNQLTNQPPRDLANKKLQKPSYEITHFRLVLVENPSKSPKPKPKKKKPNSSKFKQPNLQRSSSYSSSNLPSDKSGTEI